MEEFESETYLIEVTDFCGDHILDYFKQCLAKASLEVKFEKNFDKNVIFVKSPFNELCAQAEELELLKEVDGKDKVRKFVTDDIKMFVGHGDKSSFFTPAEQMLLIENILHKVEFSVEKFGELGVKKIHAHSSFLVACEHSKPQLVENHTPKHSTHGKKNLWNAVKRNPFVFPIQDIRNYYGEEVAFYFAWMSYFTYALVPIAIFGIAMFLHRPKGITVDDSHYLPFYALLMAFWAIMYIKGWKRTEAELALLWGTYNIEKLEVVRPEFYGKLRESPITGKPEKYYPQWKRRFRYLMSFLISLPFLMLGVGAMILSLNLNGYIKHVESPIHIASLAKYAEPGGVFAGDNPYYGWMVPTILHSLVINLINQLYRMVAATSTDIENHRTEHSWNSSLILKRVMFELFDCYLPLFYIAFYQLDIISLRRELIGLFWGDEIRRVMLESVLPFIMEKIHSRRINKKLGEAKKTDEDNKLLENIENLHYEEYEQFDDYIEMIVQFGYVTLFASAFPLCSVITILFLFLEARSDMFKLLFLCRRPIVRRAKGIGVWFNVIVAMTVLAMATNCFLFGFASEQLATWVPEMYETAPDGDQWIKDGFGRYVVGIVFGAEHVLILCLFLSQTLISDTPNHVSIEIRRREYLMEEELKLLKMSSVGVELKNKEVDHVETVTATA